MVNFKARLEVLYEIHAKGLSIVVTHYTEGAGFYEVRKEIKKPDSNGHYRAGDVFFTAEKLQDLWRYRPERFR